MRRIEAFAKIAQRLAACVLLIREDGKVLAVSRKDDPNDFGLPGGKVDPGEEPIQAAARELKEETGLTAHSLKEVFSAVDNKGFLTTTFLGSVSGDIDTLESGVIKWVTPDELFRGSFGSYNRQLFQAQAYPNSFL